MVSGPLGSTFMSISVAVPETNGAVPKIKLAPSLN
jgi:hypothetical protein